MNFFVTILITKLMLISAISADFQEFSLNFNQNYRHGEASCMDKLYELQKENPSILSTWSNFTSTHKYGNSHDFGDFFGCNNLNNTQYCLVQYFQESNPPIPVPPATSFYQKIWINLNESFLGAACFPSSCDLNDVRKILENFYETQNLTFGDKMFCKTRKSEKFGIKLNENNFGFLNWWNMPRIGVLATFFGFALLMSMSGVEKLDIVNIIKDLFKNSNSTSSTRYMNGIKAFSMILIVLVHSYGCRLVMPFKYGLNHYEYSNRIFYQVLGMLVIIMELFFIIGGVLTAMSLKKGMDASNKFAWITKFYIKRIMRILPVAIFYTILLATTDSDTMAPYNVGMSEENKKYLWFTPFIFNFLPLKTTYISLIWFVSLYLQLSLMAPIVFLLTSMKKYGNKISIAVLIVCGGIKYWHGTDGLIELTFSLPSAESHSIDAMNAKYTALRYRLLSFFGGMILEKILSQKLTISMRYAFIAFFAMLTTIMIILAVGVPMSLFNLLAAGDTILNLIFLLAIYLLHHSDWNMKKILEKSFWEPISKMGLTIYLITSYYFFSIHEREVEPIEVKNELHLFYIYLMDVLKTILPVLLTFIFVEEPWSRLGDYLANNMFSTTKK